MGGEQSNQKTKKYQSYASNLTHPKLTNAKLIKPEDQSEAPYLELVVSVPDQTLYKKWVKRIQLNHQTISKGDAEKDEFMLSLPSAGHEYIQTYYLPQSLHFERKGFCGSSGVITAKYEVFPFVLSEELSNRNKIKQPFSESQLWYLLYVLTCAGASAHSAYGTGEKSGVIGDVRPGNIVISEDGEIQTMTLETFLDQDTNFNKTSLHGIKTFLAPEQLEQLQKGEMGQSSNITPQSECFSIGLTLLSALLLEDQTKLYLGNTQDTSQEKNLSNTGFNYIEFQRDITSLRSAESYSSNLRRMIESLLHPEPSRRLTCQEAVAVLKQYEENIMNLDPFTIYPSSGRQQIDAIFAKINNSDIKGSRNAERNSFSKVINNSQYNNLNGSRRKPSIPNVSYGQQNINSYIGHPYQGPIQQQQLPLGIQNGYSSSFQPPPQTQSHYNNYESHISEVRRFEQSKQQFMPQPPGVRFPIAESHYQYHPQLQPQSQPQSQFLVPQAHSQLTTGPSPRNITVTESIYTPSVVPKTQNQPNYQQQPSVLAEMSREAHSIRPGTIRSPTSSTPNHYAFDSYDQVLKNIDKQLTESRRMFPEDAHHE